MSRARRYFLRDVRARARLCARTSRICVRRLRRAPRGRARASPASSVPRRRPRYTASRSSAASCVGEALRRRDADLRARRACRARRRSRAGSRCRARSRRRARARPLRLRGLHRGERVERLAGLAHGDDEIVRRRRPARGSGPRCRSRPSRECARAARPSSARPSPRGSSCRTRRSRRARCCFASSAVTPISSRDRRRPRRDRRGRAACLRSARGCSWISLSMKCL